VSVELSHPGIEFVILVQPALHRCVAGGHEIPDAPEFAHFGGSAK
jgi:hypothetical protein